MATFVKRMCPCEHLENDDTKAPHINPFAIPLAGCLLRRHPENGAHKLVDMVSAWKYIFIYLGWESEICNLSYQLFLPFLVNLMVKEYVHWFQISMNYIFLMYEQETIQDIFGYRAGDLIRHDLRPQRKRSLDLGQA